MKTDGNEWIVGEQRKGGDIALNQELIKLQDKVDLLGKKHNDLLAVLAAEEEKKLVLDETAANDLLPNLIRKRCEMLADRATGENVSDKSLDDLETEIAEEEAKAHSYSKNKVLAADTVKGLQMKIQKVETELDAACDEYVEVLKEFLNEKLVIANERYLQLGRDLGKAFVHVITIGNLFKKIGLDVNVHGPYTYNFKIPSFNVNGLATKDKKVPDIIFNHDEQNFPAHLQELIEQYEKDGISIPV